MIIREAHAQDKAVIKALHLDAFPSNEGALVGQLATDLLAESSIPPTLTSVLVEEGTVIAHCAFSPVFSLDQQMIGYILAPLAVASAHQKTGYGALIVRHGLAQLKQQGVKVVLVYGDPEYYGRFGFSSKAGALFTPSFDLAYPHGWQALRLQANTVDTLAPKRIICVPALEKPEYW